MDEVCEIIQSQKGNNKINVHGYLMIKERTKGDKYYWCCEKKDWRNVKIEQQQYFSIVYIILKTLLTIITHLKLVK